MAKTAWRCSNCGTVNEPDARACSNCGKWPSLFDLQNNAVEEVEPQATRGEIFEAETFEPATFEPETLEPDTLEPEVFQPEVEESGEAAERKSRFPRWAITAIWVVGILIWFLANALGDRS